MSDLISREYMKSLGATCIASRSKDGTLFPIVAIDELPSVQPDKDLIHLQKEQAYMQGYEDGRKMIRCKDCMYSMMED